MENFQLNSAEINAIAVALSAFQGQIDSAKKCAKNPHFGSKYADLASVWDCIRDVLPLYGLSIIQSILPTPEGKNILVTTLLHESGQWFRSYLPLMVDKPTSQALGSAITYARRFALSAICGISSEDDDGNAATRHVEKMQQQQQQQQQQQPAIATIEQIKSLVSILENCSDEYKHNFAEHLKKIGRTLNNLPLPIYDKLLARTCTERDSFMQAEQRRIDGEQSNDEVNA